LRQRSLRARRIELGDILGRLRGNRFDGKRFVEQRFERRFLEQRFLVGKQHIVGKW
jgi:hypothetical protein